MSTELTTKPAARASALTIMAQNLNVEPAKLLQTLKATVFKGATDDELLALVVVANTYGLSPLLREIYAFPAKGGGIVPVVSIDGWINRMNSNAQFDGIEFSDTWDEGKIASVTARIWRKDRSKPCVVTEYFSECSRNTDPWKTCPARMLRHKALIQCVRIAFGFGGVYDEDEARDITARVVPVGPDLTDLPKVEKKPEAETKEKKEEPLTLDNHAVTPAEELNAMLQSEGMTKDDLRGVLIKTKMHSGKFEKLHDLPVVLIETIIKNFDDVRAEFIATT